MINPDLALYLLVTGYGDDPAVVDTALDLTPTVVWTRGEPLSANFPDARRRRSQWMLASGLPLDAPFREHGAALLALLEPRAERLRRAAEQWHVALVVGPFYHHGDATLYLDDAQIARFAALGLEAGFDQLAHRPGFGTPLYPDDVDPDNPAPESTDPESLP